MAFSPVVDWVRIGVRWLHGKRRTADEPPTLHSDGNSVEFTLSRMTRDRIVAQG